MSDLRPVIGGKIIGPEWHIRGWGAGGTIDRLEEARELPRGYFLRLRQAGLWPSRKRETTEVPDDCDKCAVETSGTCGACGRTREASHG